MIEKIDEQIVAEGAGKKLEHMVIWNQTEEGFLQYTVSFILEIFRC